MNKHVRLCFVSLIFLAFVFPGRGLSLAKENFSSDVATTGCGGVNAALVNAEFEQQVVELVNATRAENGLPPLKRTAELDQAARYHATDQGTDNYFNHDSYNRSDQELVWVCSVWERIEAYYGVNWYGMAENIAAGYPDPKAVMAAWMGSPGHKANILSSNNWEIGVGFFSGNGDYYSYWVQDFGRRIGIYPMVINGEAAKTDSVSVSLFLYGEWQEMRLRNDEEAWTTWQPFQAVLNWTLASGAGNHTVWVELRKDGNSVVSSDSIYLDTSDAVPIQVELPDTVQFTYSIAEQRMIPASQEVIFQTGSDPSQINWNTSQQGVWFIVSPDQGLASAPLTITPTLFDTQTPLTYTGELTVTFTAPGILPSTLQTIKMVLKVVEQPFYQVYLPQIKR